MRGNDKESAPRNSGVAADRSATCAEHCFCDTSVLFARRTSGQELYVPPTEARARIDCVEHARRDDEKLMKIQAC